MPESVPDSGETMDAQGYITDTPYTIKYYARQTPGQIVAAAEAAGVAAPNLEKPFTYADFGCGRGMTLLILASVYPEAQFFGIDVNEEHVEEAQARADAAGLTNLKFLARSFGSLTEADLPPLDIAASHGVYSWVSEPVRLEMRDAMASRLTPEGLAMVSYNTRVGYASMDPLQKLLMGLAEVAPGNAVEKRRAAIHQVRRMRETKQLVFERYPTADQRVERWPKHDETYLFHEYFNAYWHPLSFVEVAREMQGAGLHFCGDTVYPTWIAGRGKQSRAAWLEDAVMLEEMACVALAQAFRYDVYTPTAALDFYRPAGIDDTTLFGLTQPPETGEVSKLSKNENATGRLLRLMASGPVTYAEIKANPVFAKAARSLPLLLRAAMATGLVAVYRRGAGTAQTPLPSAHLRVTSELGRTLLSDDNLARHMLPLPAPRFGGAVQVPPMMTAILVAALEGEAGLEERVAKRVHDLTGVDREGRKKESFEAVLQRAGNAVGRFKSQWLPFLHASGVVEAA